MVGFCPTEYIGLARYTRSPTISLTFLPTQPLYSAFVHIYILYTAIVPIRDLLYRNVCIVLYRAFRVRGDVG